MIIKKFRSVSRRDFVKKFVPQLLVWWEELHGNQNFHPYLLDDLPDEKLAVLEPVLAADSPWEIEGVQLLKVSEQDGSSSEVHQFTDQEQFLVIRFSTGQSLKTIAEAYATEFELESDVAFKQVREIFLELSKIGLCHPAQDLEV